MSWSDKQSADALVASEGSLEDLVSSVLGPTKVAPEDGDVVLCRQNGVELLGIVHDGRCVLRNTTGLTRWPLAKAAACWGV